MASRRASVTRPASVPRRASRVRKSSPDAVADAGSQVAPTAWPEEAARLAARHVLGDWVARRQLPGRGGVSPLVWAAGEFLAPDEIEAVRPWLGVPGKSARRPDVAPTLTEFARLSERFLRNGTPLTAAEGWRAVVAAHALPCLAPQADRDAWHAWRQALIDRAAPGPGSEPGGELARQVVVGELALTLAALFPELSEAERLVEGAVAETRGSLESLLDSQGLLPARLQPVAFALLASWTRTLGVLGRVGATLPAPAMERFATAVARGLTAVRADGSRALFEPAGAADHGALLHAAAEVSGRPTLRRLAALALPARGASRLQVPRGAPLPGGASEGPRVATLRNDWSPGADAVWVDYREQVARLEATTEGTTLASGAWTVRLSIDGRGLVPLGPWEDVCWVSDGDVDYLEIDQAFTGGVRLERCIVLGRSSRWLLLADTVLSSTPGEIHYAAEWPLAANLDVRPAAETRELTLAERRPRTTVLPLYLPEWRSAPADGSLEAVAGRLRWQRRGRGAGLFVPLYLALSPARLRQPLTWRRLTVAQDRQRVPPDVAEAFRVQFGREHALFYRSLGPPLSRTFLGHNLATQFLAARFTPDGRVTPLVEIE